MRPNICLIGIPKRENSKEKIDQKNKISSVTVLQVLCKIMKKAPRTSLWNLRTQSYLGKILNISSENGKIGYRKQVIT
jgi:hypothetical protein